MKRFTSILLVLISCAAHAGVVDSVGASLRDAEAQLASGRYLLALEFCRSGLKELGDSYVTSEVEDDSGMKLIAADLPFKEGRIENAAIVTCRILKERFKLWGEKPNNSFNPDALKRAD